MVRARGLGFRLGLGISLGAFDSDISFPAYSSGGLRHAHRRCAYIYVIR